jgi:hypothetical protein
MKRHAALHPLSRDHHNVLVHARRLRGLDARHDAASSRRAFLAYVDSVLRHHFAEEDAIVAPLVQDPALRRRLLDEHADLARRANALAKDPEGQADLGEALRQHVRFEEDELFPHLEGTFDEAAWSALSRGCTEFRQAVRPASADGNEVCFL